VYSILVADSNFQARFVYFLLFKLSKTWFEERQPQHILQVVSYSLDAKTWVITGVKYTAF